MQTELAADIAAIEAISSVPTILEAVAAITGLRFVCIARVSGDSWTTCAVLDRLGFGLKVGDGLDVATTLCEEVRDSGRPVIIDNVSQDARYRNHHTPRIYGFQSYISLPIQRPDGSYFGTLCGLDPLPANLSNTATVSSMSLFAQLISKHLETELKLTESQSALLSERDTSELREQFIAVLGHDLRTPLSSILLGVELLKREPLSAQATGVLERMRRSAQRISTLVNDVMDFTRGRMGGGIALSLQNEAGLQQSLEQVVAELRGAYPEHRILAEVDLPDGVVCDGGRIQQLLSNLLKNALVHGAREEPVLVRAGVHAGELEISVLNGGPAIAPATIDQLFKPFWRASGHAASEGLGLGLFIVAEIARSHGGTLEVKSDHGATRFTFRMRAGEPAERRRVARA
ncbi:ATP-binding protein [Massilia sp. CCM 9210]|uniref:GAF domain-containing sensor histidine kinase n=1 Tax=Massilia scottii TaxID=3057166 RepID=UPI002796B964|nr:ATP-binding protein [Massilia sp. CCM 9210]MDQ1813407.1 ATP-binding protein [Massilia sp. CCM 9210]